MKLYSITVSIGENGFETNILNSNVVLYERNGKCKVEHFGYTREFNSCELDEYKIGLISSKTPSVSIETIGEEFVDQYVGEMKRMIEDELVERMNRTQKQLETINS